MLRKPIGNYKVGVCEIDTDEYGTLEYRRKGALLFFFPADSGMKKCSYKNVEYQKELLNQNIVCNDVDTFCYTDAVISNMEEEYPIILYNHSIMGYQMESTMLCADLASMGYIVVSVGHPFGSGALTYTDGSLFHSCDVLKINQSNIKLLGDLWEEDINYAIDYLERINTGFINSQFTGRMKSDHSIWLLGASFGGCCSIRVAMNNRKVSGVINLDGGLFLDLKTKNCKKPILVICRPININAYLKLKIKRYSNLHIEKIKKISHWEFTDGIYLSNQGKKNRKFADTVSIKIDQICLEFISKSGNH